MGYGASDGFCNTGLSLSLGFFHIENKENNNISQSHRRPHDQNHLLRSSDLTLGLPEDYHSTSMVKKMEADAQPQTSNSVTVSSFSNSSVKKERGFDNFGDEADVEIKISSRISDEDDEGSPRKKLRLTKDQSAVLEDSFREHSTLNPKQKQGLADQLNLRPRQVEVWFQNRRARTKLKQTEVDCELLKKCCETLTEENKRLQKELQDLKSSKLISAPLCMQLPSATLTMCPSCGRIGSRGDGGVEASSTTVRPNPHFCNQFTHPSTAF